MEKEKVDIMLKKSYEDLNLVVFPSDRITVMEITPHADYEENRDLYVRSLSDILIARGIGDESDMTSEESEHRMNSFLSKMFHHLMNPEVGMIERNLNPFSNIKIQIQHGKAYIMIGNLKGYNEGDIEESSFIDGDHFLWGLVY